MDRPLIERLAREAGPGWLIDSDEYDAWPDDLHRFAALVAEECAKLCEAEPMGDGGLDYVDDCAYGHNMGRRLAAESIRAKFALDSLQPSPSPTTD